MELRTDRKICWAEGLMPHGRIVWTIRNTFVHLISCGIIILEIKIWILQKGKEMLFVTRKWAKKDSFNSHDFSYVTRAVQNESLWFTRNKYIPKENSLICSPRPECYPGNLEQWVVIKVTPGSVILHYEGRKSCSCSFMLLPHQMAFHLWFASLYLHFHDEARGELHRVPEARRKLDASGACKTTKSVNTNIKEQPLMVSHCKYLQSVL